MQIVTKSFCFEFTVLHNVPLFFWSGVVIMGLVLSSREASVLFCRTSSSRSSRTAPRWACLTYNVLFSDHAMNVYVFLPDLLRVHRAHTCTESLHPVQQVVVLPVHRCAPASESPCCSPVRWFIPAADAQFQPVSWSSPEELRSAASCWTRQEICGNPKVFDGFSCLQFQQEPFALHNALSDNSSWTSMRFIMSIFNSWPRFWSAWMISSLLILVSYYLKPLNYARRTPWFAGRVRELKSTQAHPWHVNCDTGALLLVFLWEKLHEFDDRQDVVSQIRWCFALCHRDLC